MSLNRLTIHPGSEFDLGLALNLKPHFGQVSAFELISLPHSLHLIKATAYPFLLPNV